MGSDSVVIAVIDTGIVRHSDIWDRLLWRSGFLNNPDTLVGYDFISDRRKAGDGDGIDPDPTDPAGLGSDFHGTHVAGTIGAETNNGLGVAGVTWLGEIMPLRVLGPSGSGTNYDISQAILFAAGLPNSSGWFGFADIINMSLGSLLQNCGGTGNYRG